MKFPLSSQINLPHVESKRSSLNAVIKHVGLRNILRFSLLPADRWHGGREKEMLNAKARSKARVMRGRSYFWPCPTVPPTPSVTGRTSGWVSQWARMWTVNWGDSWPSNSQWERWRSMWAGGEAGSFRGRFSNNWSLSQRHGTINEAEHGSEWQRSNRAGAAVLLQTGKDVEDVPTERSHPRLSDHEVSLWSSANNAHDGNQLLQSLVFVVSTSFSL